MRILPAASPALVRALCRIEGLFIGVGRREAIPRLKALKRLGESVGDNTLVTPMQVQYMQHLIDNCKTSNVPQSMLQGFLLTIGKM